MYPIAPEKLRVFPTDADLPHGSINDVIDKHFVPMAKVKPPNAGDFDAWKLKLINGLRSVTFRSFPDRIPAARLIETSDKGEMKLETEAGIIGALKLEQTAKELKRIVLHVNQGQSEHSVIEGYNPESSTIYRFDPRGTGDTRWAARNPPNYVARSHLLISRTVDDGRIWDIVATARYLKQKHGKDLPLFVSGEKEGAVLAAYTALLEPAIDGAVLVEPVMSHTNEACPPLLNVLRVCDIKDVLGALAPKPLELIAFDKTVTEKVKAIY